MKKTSYLYGMKLAAVMLHSFFTVIMAIALALFIFLMENHVLQLADTDMLEYEQLYPWIKSSLACGMLGVVGWILTLVYLTVVSGRRTADGTIHLNRIDSVKMEFLFVGFLMAVGKILVMVGEKGKMAWSLPGLLVASGSISFLVDAFFLICYLSMVRRVKAKAVWKYSFARWLIHGLKKIFQERTVTVRILLLFAVHMLGCFVLALGIFRYGNLVCLLMLLLLFGAEAYVILQKGMEAHLVLEGVRGIASGDLSVKINVEELHGEARDFAEAVNNIGSGLLHAVDENTKNERMKADLITNVSHDIKTPLTSIINYINLIQREEIENERVRMYVRVLDEKSQRLKQLTEDLVEASKISSGNVKLDMQRIDMAELVRQTGGEFNEKFEAKELLIVTRLPKQAVYIHADGRYLYRVIENLYNNAAKYALEKTRVYVDVSANDGWAEFSIKNISERSLALENSSAGDLTERFVRGDASRTTEGSGLGLSIARNLTVLMGGTFHISVDGDLFKANIVFPLDAETLDF